MGTQLWENPSSLNVFYLTISLLLPVIFYNFSNPRRLSTYALTLFRYNTEIDGKHLSVDFWDTAGQEQFDTLHPSYYFDAHACILCFDVTRKITYKNLLKWYSELREFCPRIPCILIANKIDVDMKVTKKKFAFAVENNLPMYFVSASDGTNVVRIFSEAVQLAHAYSNDPTNGDAVADLLDLLREGLETDDSTRNGSYNELDEPDSATSMR